MDRFNAVKNGMSERYGVPTAEKGKYLDSFATWDLGGADVRYIVNIEIAKNTIIYIAGFDPSKTHPFRVFITYYNETVADLLRMGQSG